MEGTPGPKKKVEQKKSGVLEAGALALGLLGAFDHGPAQALEIDPHASWTAGVEDKIRPSVMKEGHEYATVFVRYTDGSTGWLSPTEGTWGGVTPDIQAHASQLKAEKRGKEVAVDCHIHTHGLSSIHKGFKVGGLAPSAPPSGPDINMARTSPALYKKSGIEGLKTVHAEFDPRGVWYYRPLTESDFKDPAKREEFKKVERLRRLEETKKLTGEAVRDNAELLSLQSMFAQENIRVIQSFVEVSASLQHIPSSYYKELEHAYRLGFHAKVRFVPYDKLPDEPDCAGADYDPHTS